MHLSPHKYTLMTRPRVSINAVFERYDIYNMRTLTSMKIECFSRVTLYILSAIWLDTTILHLYVYICIHTYQLI